MHRNALIVTLVAATSLVAAPAAKDKGFIPIDIQKFGNKEVTSNFAGGDETNILKDFPTGEKTLADVKFVIGKKLIMLGSKAQPDEPAAVDNIPIGRVADRLHFLHANGYGGGPNKEGSDLFVKDGTTIGAYVIHYDDKTKAEAPIVYGEHSRDWFFTEDEKEPSKAKVAWTGENKFATDRRSKVRVYRMTWENPNPNKKIASIDFVGRKDETVGAPFVIAITAEVK
ncbi:MAG TPA: hypothetical protein VHR66_07185 [Gemmataceae bacterium]|jgi:hypothetical protein|nr:hypothetical protein [Gemmataceae bacterium]